MAGGNGKGKKSNKNNNNNRPQTDPTVAPWRKKNAPKLSDPGLHRDGIDGNCFVHWFQDEDGIWQQSRRNISKLFWSAQKGSGKGGETGQNPKPPKKSGNQSQEGDKPLPSNLTNTPSDQNSFLLEKPPGLGGGAQAPSTPAENGVLLELEKEVKFFKDAANAAAKTFGKQSTHFVSAYSAQCQAEAKIESLKTPEARLLAASNRLKAIEASISKSQLVVGAQREAAHVALALFEKSEQNLLELKSRKLDLENTVSNIKATFPLGSLAAEQHSLKAAPVFDKMAQMLGAFDISRLEGEGRDSVLENLAGAVANLNTLSAFFSVYQTPTPPPPPPIPVVAVPIHTPTGAASPRRETPIIRKASEAFGHETDQGGDVVAVPSEKLDEDGDQEWDDEDASLFAQSRTRFRAANPVQAAHGG